METRESQVTIDSSQVKKTAQTAQQGNGINMKNLMPLIANQNPEMANMLSLLNGEQSSDKLMATLLTSVMNNQKNQTAKTQSVEKETIDLTKYKIIK